MLSFRDGSFLACLIHMNPGNLLLFPVATVTWSELIGAIASERRTTCISTNAPTIGRRRRPKAAFLVHNCLSQTSANALSL
jgi:hypothetical protein